MYIPQEQGGPVISTGTGFPFRRPLRLAGLRWRYSNPPSHGVPAWEPPRSRRRDPSTALYSSSQVKVKVTLRLTASQSVSLGVESHLGLMTRYLLLFDSYGLVLCGVPSLTRGRICLLYMLLALASAVFLRSESLGNRDHILLSQI
jgi:hypothetical protein